MNLIFRVSVSEELKVHIKYQILIVFIKFVSIYLLKMDELNRLKTENEKLTNENMSTSMSLTMIQVKY